MAYAVPPDEGLTLRALYLPFFKEPLILDMGPFAVAMFALIIVGASNAVNLTDGLDGLATGCSLTTAIAYAGFGYICGNAEYSEYLGVAHHTLANELPIIAMALAGACLGFLWYNAHPARMFMEAMSVIIQVVSFKKRGKRVFRMAPIHHHFELGGWHENQVIVRFWAMSLLFAMLGLATLKLR